MTDLHATLRRLGLSQAAFARLCGTTRQTVSRWMDGERAEPHWLRSWLQMYEMLTREQRVSLAWPGLE